ncbi:MAG: hypothetical protein IT308_05150 [Anaerolineaceae bacterium]|nr:hypothetical protein [Anaerolineaceae bacterium]
MYKIRKHVPLFLRVTVTALWVALLVGFYGDLRARFLPIIQKGTAFPRSLAAALVLFLIFSALILLQTWRAEAFSGLNRLRAALGWLRWVLVLITGAFTSWFFLFTKWSEVFSGPYLRLTFLLLTLWGMAWLATSAWREVINWHAFLASMILFGSIFVLTDALTGVVSYPFGLFWSEGNRIWDYSVLYGHRLYNYPADKLIPAYIDLGRQSLWGMPFLFFDASIVTIRLWSALLFTIPYILFGLFAFYKMKNHRVLWLLAALWTMIFLNQGPIYTPLIWIAILVTATRRMPVWLGALVVVLASYYAIFSRSTWMFAPGIWAALIAFVENNPYGVQKTFQRWVRAIIFGLAGIFGSNLIQPIQVLIKTWQEGGVPTSSQLGAAVGAVGRQPLLWDRLLPNPTFPAGVLFALFSAAGPLIILLIICGLRSRWVLNIWQKLALWGSALAFLAVGVIVSVKIGGGNNLHNLDMFLITIIFITALAWEAGIFAWMLKPARYAYVLHILLFLVILAAASKNMMGALPRALPSQEKAEEVIGVINEAIANVGDTGEILFIDQRQLLTFGNVPRIPLVAEYEKKWMMDEAMANSAAYFAPFFRDLSTHRFALIVSEPLWIKFQGGGYNFGNENDAWVKWVSVPVLCSYQPIETYLDVGIQLLVPRTEPLEEPGIVCPQP